MAVDLEAGCGNALLSALRRDDVQRIAPDLRRDVIGGGVTLIDPGQPPVRLYFPETAIIALRSANAAGRTTDIGLVGREGMIGWEALLGAAAPPQRAVSLLQGGTLLSILATRLRAACDASPSLARSLLSFIPAFVDQLAQTIVASACDPAERRIARWLLMIHDRIDGDTFAIRHSELAAMLNLRRATVTDCLHILEGERALRCTRGHIAIRDRRVLDALARTSRCDSDLICSTQIESSRAC